VIEVVEMHRRDHPGADIEVKGAATGGGAAELIDGRASVLVTVQPWTDADTAAFEGRYGYDPLQVKVATAQGALHVYRDNPLEALSQRDVDAIYSRTLRCGGSGSAENWRDVGVEAAVFSARPIQPYVQAGLVGVVRARLLCGGDLRPDVARMPSAALAVEAVRRDPDGIALALRREHAGVKILPLIDTAEPGRSSASGADPLRWDVYVYMNRPSLGELPQVLGDFLRATLGSAGRDAFARAGLEPVPAADSREVLQALGGD
jgi:phosphate transport system substrate-binding protein